MEQFPTLCILPVKFCDVAKVAIIHKKTYPNLAIHKT
jgi:hypothetical protein